MTKISANTVVAFDYTLKDKGGNVLDSSSGREPLSYLHGAGNIIRGLEKELEGLACGDKKHVRVSPEEGYGVVHPALQIEVPRERFDFQGKIEKGMRFHVQNPDGSVMAFVVVEAGNEKVRLDGNHPLAGVELFFDVEIKEIRAATEKELAQGHPDFHDACSGGGEDGCWGGGEGGCSCCGGGCGE